MSTPEEPRELLGDPLWDALGHAEEPELSAAFDDAFQGRLRAERSRSWGLPAASGIAVMALAAGLLLTLGTPPPEPHLPSTDLDLVADLELVENLALLSDLEVLMAWDGITP